MADDLFHVPLIIRGHVVAGQSIEHGGRGGGIRFTAPDINEHLAHLALKQASNLDDLYALSTNDILDFLDALGERLVLSRNRWLQEAFALSCHTSGLGVEILRQMYETMGQSLKRDTLREVTDNAIGLPYLDGWVENQFVNGVRGRVRAFGARTVHIVAGNAPGTSCLTVARNALTRGDAIIKTPSNDPLTAAAIARTMIDIAPDHPVTKHLSVAYWKGGDDRVESEIYQSSNIEKIVAWGGMASIKHIAKYIQPGIELIALDPKLSSTIIGPEAFKDDDAMMKVADLLAVDAGGLNQEGCVNARVVYVVCGTSDAAIAKLERFGEMLYAAIQRLPEGLSCPASRINPALAEEIDALRLGGDEWYKVIGGGKAGAVIVSRMDEPVDFAAMLANRVVNLVPVDDAMTPVKAVTSYTQTIGIYPESLKTQLRDKLAIHGAQRLVSLGGAIGMHNHGIQDAIEPMRRMCRWIVDESMPSSV